ncbi:hypothetical protein [Microvirga tunisiensis]|uniref:Uncharacterized protein n=1 Tax=Microvirga tunisiensis TaxID=2108360 RepID=A0A5N7MBT3_9HYPH|nr:hypothetical protein [Microvirga tunisiensis]MPR06314.1 hypothetical protein [Microvirga tunisiensis]MPR24100.1 hypothetical protein [Microvirga tunisiensis]
MARKRAESPSPPPTPRQSDIFADILIRNRIVTEFTLELNWGALRDPDCKSKSRLLQWPLTYIGVARGGPLLKLASHQLAEHPFVLKVAELTGLGPVLDEDDNHRQYHHAVDLSTDDDWRELLETRHLTTPEHIAGGVGFGVSYGYLSTVNARHVLKAAQIPEPDGRSEQLLLGTSMSPSKSERRYIPNFSGHSFDRLWMAIHGLENGWLCHDQGGHLKLTTKTIQARGLPALA